LLQDLLKHTWESHADFQNLSNALGEITTTALYVNEKQKEAENIQKVLSIQATLTGKNLKVRAGMQKLISYISVFNFIYIQNNQITEPG